MARRKRFPAHCHPERELHQDGLCAVCFFDQKRIQELRNSPAKLEERNALVTLHQQVEHVVNLGKQAKAILRENLPRYAELHLTAAEIAASNGDAKPMEWALTAIKGEKGERVVEPPKSEGGSSGVKVMIGIQMGGIPTLPQGTVETVESSE